MSASQEHIDLDTPMGANLTASGATFRVWAPAAESVYVCGDFNDWGRGEAGRLVRQPGTGYWAGFIPSIKDGTHYKFWIRGQGSEGYKRDPYARELTSPHTHPGTIPFPSCNCVVRDPESYPWHDRDFRPPAFNDAVIYQFHVGTFYGTDESGKDTRIERVSRFLDVLFRIEYLASLGVNAIQPLPIDEFPTEFSLGYNGVDLFSPEMEYTVPASELGRYAKKLNELLKGKLGPSAAPVKAEDLKSHANQLKALIDACHVYGMAVFLDVVYNHAGGGFDDESIYFFDRQPDSNPSNSLYFTNKGFAGGLAFDFDKPEVRRFVLDNARFFVSEYHVDGFRYDEVSALVGLSDGSGWSLCQELTDTIKFIRPSNVQIAEYWPVNPGAVKQFSEGGAGFDAEWNDALRDSIRSAVRQASAGVDAPVDMDAIAGAICNPGFAAEWKAVQCIENHDIVYKKHEGSARVPAIADGSNHRSWYAESRDRAATGLLLTAPGIPMLFMGQEFMEDKPWSDNPREDPESLIWWEGLKSGEMAMKDQLKFTEDLIKLRRRHPALRAEPIKVFHVHNVNRVIGFHRWVGGAGRDVVVVASLNEKPLGDYEIGFPLEGKWTEVFNSDVYENFKNPDPVGNGGEVVAKNTPRDGMPCSAKITIPPNGIVVFARDEGDSLMM